MRVAAEQNPKLEHVGQFRREQGCAASPATTWPATCARVADLNLTSFGFGGQCHMDQAMARVIRDMEADCISLKLGINVRRASFQLLSLS